MADGDFDTRFASLQAWRSLCAARQAVRDAATLPARFAALCAYQGELAAFVDAHWAQLDAAFGQSIDSSS